MLCPDWIQQDMTNPNITCSVLCVSRLSPPQVVLVLMVHKAFRADYVGQFGGQEAVVSVDDGQTLVLQLNHRDQELNQRHLPHCSGFNGNWSTPGSVHWPVVFWVWAGRELASSRPCCPLLAGRSTPGQVNTGKLQCGCCSNFRYSNFKLNLQIICILCFLINSQFGDTQHYYYIQTEAIFRLQYLDLLCGSCLLDLMSGFMVHLTPFHSEWETNRIFCQIKIQEKGTKWEMFRC